MQADTGWRSLWLSSGALSVAILGDALLYVVLPPNAERFGVTLAWAGVLLAANRLVRTVAYGAIARVGMRIGTRRLCLGAAWGAVASTAAYGILEGPLWLLAARLLWGLSYGGLLLGALAFAAAEGATRGSGSGGGTGLRVGASRAIEQGGPLVALTGGAWLAGELGPREVFLPLALATGVAVWLAALLPPGGAGERPASVPAPGPGGAHVAMYRPGRMDVLVFWLGFAVDGVFTMTLALMLGERMALESAMLWAGSVIAVRRVVEMGMAPLAGVLADRLGLLAPMAGSGLLLAAGLALVGSGALLTGAALLIVARGALGTLIPTAVARGEQGAVLARLARNQTWRDLGAAAGPLTTGFALAVVSPATLHLVLAAICLASAAAGLFGLPGGDGAPPQGRSPIGR